MAAEFCMVIKIDVRKICPGLTTNDVCDLYADANLVAVVAVCCYRCIMILNDMMAMLCCRLWPRAATEAGSGLHVARLHPRPSW